jgi:hypothetical protein
VPGHRRSPPQREGYELPSDAFVVRGGEMLDQDLKHAAVNCLMMYEILGISVVVADVPEVEDLVRQARPAMKIYSTIHVCRVRDLDQRLYRLLPTFNAPHYTLVLPSIDDEVLVRLRNRFSRMDNPLRRRS